jgi:hypothetical protein
MLHLQGIKNEEKSDNLKVFCVDAEGTEERRFCAKNGILGKNACKHIWLTFVFCFQLETLQFCSFSKENKFCLNGNYGDKLIKFLDRSIRSSSRIYLNHCRKMHCKVELQLNVHFDVRSFLVLEKVFFLNIVL